MVKRYFFKIRERILEYAGSWLFVADREARDRLLRHKGDLNSYMLTVRSTGCVLDVIKGNSASFCNHSCEPKAKYSTMILYFPVIQVVFATVLVNFPARTEVSLDYD